LLVEAEEREKLGVTVWEGWVWGWRGEDWGEPLEREPSDEEELIEDNCEVRRLSVVIVWVPMQPDGDGGECCRLLTSSSVNNPGQNSRSSSRSNDLPASKRAREADTTGLSVNSFMLLNPLNCLWEFWEADRRGALRDRPP